MTTQHTLGPWCLMPLEDGVEYLRIRGTRLGSRYKICNVHAPLQYVSREVLESQANARLIAAAPDMLEALLALNKLQHGKHPLQINVMAAWALLDHAIAKATGENHE